jgi:nucleotide-binding universal stress UspA family protein
MGGTIVCDVTEPLARASSAQFAGALGARLGLRLVLVYVLVREAGRTVAEGTLAAIAAELRPDPETRIAMGEHVEALARVADEEGADLVVVGARTAGLGGRNLRWSLARELAAATPVPVLVAPPTTRKRSARRLAVAGDAESR